MSKNKYISKSFFISLFLLIIIVFSINTPVALARSRNYTRSYKNSSTTTVSVFKSVAVISSNYTIKVGETSQFNAINRDQNDNPYLGNVTTTFKSSNPGVAMVDATGLVKGISVGTSVITATSTNGSIVAVDTATATVIAGSSTPTPLPEPLPTTPTPIPNETSTPVPSSSLKWGVFLPSGTLSSFEQKVGQEADMQATFIGWNTSFPSSMANSLKSSGKTLVIFWENTGVSLDSIISGSSDAYIRNFAAQAKLSGTSVILAPFHEMNGNWDTWDGTVGNNSSAKIISAWRHIHDLFSGVTNVKFAWDVNNVSVPNTTTNAITAYYPGDNYVDYVAVDGFNFGGETWDQVFPSSLMNLLSSYNKPVYILSTGSVAGTQKAQWIKDMGNHIKNYPSVVGWVWFNQNGADGNWLVDSDPASLQSFISILPQ